MLYMAFSESILDEEPISSSRYFKLFLVQAQIVNLMQSQRYSYRNKYRTWKRANSLYEQDVRVEGSETGPVWLSDEEFLQKYRMTRASFQYVLQQIQTHDVFRSGPKGRKQRPVSYQLMTTLKALGSEGNAFSNPNLRHVFHNGRGTNSVYIKRVTIALRHVRGDFIRWPTDEEKDIIKAEIESTCNLPNCVGIIDGTLFPLAFEPQTHDAPDYKGRKHGYTLSFLICCDHRSLITHYYGGWPGCSHDNRIFRSSELYLQPQSFFADSEYIIGDSAFENQWFSVSAYSKPPSGVMDPHEQLFNTYMSKARVTSEHCIGLLKGRFPWLRSIRKVITETPSQTRSLLHLIDATVILHNMLIRQGDTPKNIEEDWDNKSEATQINDPNRLPVDDELNIAVPVTAEPGHRRQQLTHYLAEKFGV